MASDMFLKIDGIEGEARGDKHENEIDIQSWNWGVAQSGSMHVGGGGGSGKVAVNDLVVTKSVDSASPVLMLKCCKGEHIAEANLTVRKAGGDQQEFLKMKMEKVLITSVSPVAGAEDPAETLSLSFEKVQYDYFPQDEKGGLGPAVSLVWNVPKNTDK